MHRLVLRFLSRFWSRFRPYIAIVFVVLVFLILFRYILPSLDIERISDVVLYICSAVIQAYAALIAIPFTIAVIHLQSKYGVFAVGALLNRLSRLLLIFAIILCTLYFFMVIGVSKWINHSDLARLLILESIIVVSFLPIPFVLRYINLIITLGPAEITEHIINVDTAQSLLNKGEYRRLSERFEKAFKLLSICITDPSLYTEFTSVAEKIASVLNEAVIPYIRSCNDESKYFLRSDIIHPIFYYFRRYVVDYLRIRKPLMLSDELTPLLKTLNAMVVSSIVKGIFHAERNHYDYFVKPLKTLIKLYIEEGRVKEAISIPSGLLQDLLSDHNVELGIKSIHEKILEKPFQYDEELPHTYDVLIDYAGAIFCATIEMIVNSRDENVIKSGVVQEFIMYMLFQIVTYPELLINYVFKNEPVYIDMLINIIMEQDMINKPRLIAELVGILIRGDTFAENYLNDDDKQIVFNNIKNLALKLIEATRSQELYITVYPSLELKLMLNGRSASISEVLGDTIDKHDLAEICVKLMNMGFKVYCDVSTD